jgi:hypothetical protein
MNSKHNTEKGKLGNAGRAPSVANYTLAFALQLSKNTEKPQLGLHNTRTINNNKNNVQ